MADEWIPAGMNKAKPIALADLGNIANSKADFGPLEPKEASLVKAGFVQQAAPKSKTAPARVRTDDLIQRAEELSDFTPDEKDYLQRVESSRQLVIQRAKEDPNVFGRDLMLKMQDLKGDQKYDALVDAADELKIAERRKTSQAWADGGNASAFVDGLLNEASFNQLTKLYAYAGSRKEGGPSYEELLKHYAEESRLFQKAHPHVNVSGRIANYFIPYSPTKLLFQGLTSGAAKLAASVLPKAMMSAAMSAKAIQAAGGTAPIADRAAQVATNAISSGLGGGATGAVNGLVKGSLGKDFQEFDLSRGFDTAKNEGVTAALISAAIPIGGALLSEGASAVAPGAIRAAGRLEQGVKKVVENVTGTPAKSLSEFNKNPTGVKAAFGTETEITENLLDFLLNAKKSKLPELQQADAMLDHLPDVEIGSVLKFLRSVKKTTAPESDAVAKRLSEWADRIELRLPRTAGQKPVIGTSPSGAPIYGEAAQTVSTKAPARMVREFIDDMQGILDDKGAYGREAGAYLNTLKFAARSMRKGIIDTAKAEGGEAGAVYEGLMVKGAEKVRLLKYMGKKLGRTEELQAANGDKLFRETFGTNGTFIQSRMKDLDAKFADEVGEFGGPFFQRYQLAQHAKQLGNNGAPAWLPQQTTGAFSKGSNILGTVMGAGGTAVGYAAGGPATAAVGGLVAGAVGKGMGTVLSSPKMGRVIVGAAENITKAAKIMFADPAALKVISQGRVGVKLPIELRQIAFEIEHALTHDGPASAAGVLRLVADTPYYAVLLHAFDIAQTNQQKATQRSALMKQAQTQGIAVQPK